MTSLTTIKNHTYYDNYGVAVWSRELILPGPLRGLDSLHIASYLIASDKAVAAGFVIDFQHDLTWLILSSGDIYFLQMIN